MPESDAVAFSIHTILMERQQLDAEDFAVLGE
ncbi:hypothetical protein [Aliiruegeria sabulilitoris]